MISWLKRDEFISVLTQRRSKKDFAVGAEVMGGRGTLRVWTDKFEEIEIPISYFAPNAKFKPDFDRLELIDHGLTIKLGDYEVNAQNAIQYGRDGR